jgi:UDP-N-acetyl-D-glucosamine dehydrogenase
MPFYPGPGVGGHCIPLDPHYLEWKAKQYDFVTRFISLAGDVNRSMPAFVRSKCVRLLSNKGLALSKAKVLLIGVAYKSNVDDWRESPAIDVWNLLEERGANVRFTDPHVKSAMVNGRERKSVGYTAEDLAWADLVVVTTWHGDLDPAFMMEHADLILDTRGATRHCEVPKGCARVLL